MLKEIINKTKLYEQFQNTYQNSLGKKDLSKTKIVKETV